MEAAAPVTNAPAVEAPPPGSVAAEFGEADPIFAALANHTPEEFVAESEEAAAGTEAKKPEAKTEPEKPKEPEPEKPDAKSKRKKLESEVFSEQALTTPDGVKRAREYVQQRQSKLDGMGQRYEADRAQLTADQKSFEEAVQHAQRELEPQRQLAQRFITTLRRLEDPSSIEDFLGAIDELSGKRGKGLEIWENGARFMVAGGKKAPPSREAEALRAELADLKRTLTERDQRNERAREEGETSKQREFIARREGEILSAAKDAARFPELAKHMTLGMAPNIVAEVVNKKRDARARGQKLGDAEALGIIEGELKKLTAPEARVSASPAGASPAEARVSGIAPSMTRSAGSVRDKTEAELAEDLAKDTAALSHILGVQF